MQKKLKIMRIIMAIVLGTIAFGLGSSPQGLAQDAANEAVARRIGAIKSINGNTLTLAPSSGPEVAVSVEANARLLRMAPGDKDLKKAIPIQLQDLKVGDMVRVRGRAAGSGIDALEVLVITAAALNVVTDQIRQDWQKRGLGGLVDSVNPAMETVTIS